ncbi:MAG: MBOAT family protein [Kiritimatiellae bacterium]|nr:MBOAT family protein [Kiritimatiellia bacterium]
MPFTTVDYICFFAAVFFGYYAAPQRARWWLLLGASWVFYGWMSPYYCFFLAFTVALTYWAAAGVAANFGAEKKWLAEKGKTVERAEKKAYKSGMEAKRRRYVAAAVAGLLAMLAVFKYLEFIFANVSWLGGALGWQWKAPALNLILPVGLSFYVFQSMAYVIDVGRGEVAAERNFFRHALFVSYFPQIMQGPIGNYGRLAHQFYENHPFDYNQAAGGLLRVAWGFFKKVMIANLIADRINPVWGSAGDYHGAIFWGAVLVLYAIQLFADFSGYMDIACGCSQMLGIKLDENFNCPYFARSVSEFWRRWHMTLSGWFKDYLFYPVLRSGWNTRLRKSFANRYLASTVPTSVALAIVWAATGLWHGASWGYVAWGVYYGVFMILGVVLAPVYDRLHRKFPGLLKNPAYMLFQMLRTFAIVVAGYSIFKPADMSVTVQIWKQAFSALDGGGVNELVHTLRRTALPVLGWISLMFAVDVVHYVRGEGVVRGIFRKMPWFARWPVYVAMLWVMIYFGVYGSGFDQFEYFKF